MFLTEQKLYQNAPSVGRPYISKFSVQYGDYRLSIVQNLFIFVACIIQAKTTNLYELRNEVGKITEKCNTETESHYKRLTRFILLNSFGNLWYYILCYGLDLLNLKLDVCYLDGTEWYISSFRLPILVLAVDHQGIAIPVNATIIKAYCQNMNGFIFWKMPVNVAS